MEFGIRALLLLVAIVLFFIAIFSNIHQGDLIAAGLAVFAAAFLVELTPLAKMNFTGGAPRSTTRS